MEFCSLFALFSHVDIVLTAFTIYTFDYFMEFKPYLTFCYRNNDYVRK